MAYKRACDELFIEAAIDTAARYGIENFRTKDVADRAGFSEATLFRHFETKEVLLISTFLAVDKKISDILIHSRIVTSPVNGSFEVALYGVWRSIYRYLIEHRSETLFLIRFRYSTLYTDEVRSQRQAYSGAFDEVYRVFEENLGGMTGSYRGFLINYIFEMTLCFAEKVVTGRFIDSVETEHGVWTTVSAAMKEIVHLGDSRPLQNSFQGAVAE